MGRPIKKDNFGDPLSGGRQLDQIDAWIPGESGEEKCWIVRQASNHKYVVHGRTSGNEGMCQLVDKAAGSLAEGEMMMTCTPFGSSAERVKSISQHKVKTFSNNRYIWRGSVAASVAGECDLAPAQAGVVEYYYFSNAVDNGPDTFTNLSNATDGSTTTQATVSDSDLDWDLDLSSLTLTSDPGMQINKVEVRYNASVDMQGDSGTAYFGFETLIHEGPYVDLGTAFLPLNFLGIGEHDITSNWSDITSNFVGPSIIAWQSVRDMTARVYGNATHATNATTFRLNLVEVRVTYVQP
jgi:hypothetical protein